MKNPVLAQQVKIDGQSIQGPIQIDGLSPDQITLGAIVNRILQFLLPFAGIILLSVLIWGGYDYMMSQGNPDKIKNAQAKITTGLVGFGILVFSYLIVRLIATIFGLQGGII